MCDQQQLIRMVIIRITIRIGLEMTYTVSSGTLNSSIPYHTIPDRPTAIIKGIFTTASHGEMLNCRLVQQHW